MNDGWKRGRKAERMEVKEEVKEEGEGGRK